MPERQTLQRARRDARQGKSPSTQAGEFVREEIEHVREGKHGARSTKQAIAIGLSKARRSGIKLPPPRKGTAKASTRAAAKRDASKGRAARKGVAKKTSRTRSRATTKALSRESRRTASHAALAKHARSSARRRSAADRSAAARKAARTRARHG